MTWGERVEWRTLNAETGGELRHEGTID